MKSKLKNTKKTFMNKYWELLFDNIEPNFYVNRARARKELSETIYFPNSNQKTKTTFYPDKKRFMT
jgi:hypothetical protein